MESMGGGILQIAEHDLATGRCELRLDGELDLWSVERLQALLQRVARENDAILVGLQSCDFVDSTGIALILQVGRQLEDGGGRLAVYGYSDQVLRIFTIAVPDLTNRTLRASRKILHRAHCKLGRVRGERRREVRVVEQYRQVGRVLPIWAAVDVKAVAPDQYSRSS
jgi:anti-anti-sigma factor